MKKKSENMAREIHDATLALETALARVRELASSPVEVGYGNVTLLVHPANHDNRIDICCGTSGHTTVNYTNEGVIVDIYSGEQAGYELLKTVAIPGEDLSTNPDSQGQPEKAVTVIVEARPLSDFGDGPTAASVVLNSQFFKKLAERQLRITSAGTSAQLTVEGAPANWYPMGIGEEIHLICPEMVCMRDGFWFTDRPKHASYDVETEWMGTENLLALFEAAKNGQTVVLGSDQFKSYVGKYLTVDGEIFQSEEAAHG